MYEIMLIVIGMVVENLVNTLVGSYNHSGWKLYRHAERRTWPKDGEYLCQYLGWEGREYQQVLNFKAKNEGWFDNNGEEYTTVNRFKRVYIS